jgi:hypothetical protein
MLGEKIEGFTGNVGTLIMGKARRFAQKIAPALISEEFGCGVWSDMKGIGILEA